jgi:uncharacterized protein involved in cysteine biosynthesis
VNLLSGFVLPFRAMRLILSHPRLMAWSSLPMLLALAVEGAGYYWLSSALESWLRGWMARMEWGGAGAVVFLANAVLVVAAALTFSFVASLAAVPFNDFLAEASEPHAQVPPAPAPSLPQRARFILIDLMKSGAALALTLLALALSWIPVLNLAALGITAFLLAFQFVSYPQTRRGQGLRAAFRFLSGNPGLSLGFGLAVLGLFAIPFLSFLFIAPAVVGGTLLYARGRQ